MTDTVPVKVVAPVAVTDDGDKPMRPASKKARAKKPVSKSADKPSVKEWLQAQVDKHGEVKVDAAKKWVEDSGRSPVTLYRQAGELELKLDRKAGVWRRAK